MSSDPAAIAARLSPAQRLAAINAQIQEVEAYHQRRIAALQADLDAIDQIMTGQRVRAALEQEARDAG